MISYLGISPSLLHCALLLIVSVLYVVEHVVMCINKTPGPADQALRISESWRAVNLEITEDESAYMLQV